VKLALVALALVACNHIEPPREPIANTAPPPLDAAAPSVDANPCDVFFLLSQRALECTQVDRATHDKLQAIVDGMVGAVSESGLDEDPHAPERECAEATTQTRMLAAACRL
jgi:hypothetical protein